LRYQNRYHHWTNKTAFPVSLSPCFVPHR
jgi:hypothetical protein